MECAEQHLRDILASVHGEYAGKSLLELIEQGRQIVVRLESGETLVLSNVTEALHVMLERFHWKRKIDWSNERAPAYVLNVCQRIEKRFALSEVVTRVAHERPELVGEFAAAWGALIKHRLIRMVQRANPSLYEVAEGTFW